MLYIIAFFLFILILANPAARELFFGLIGLILGLGVILLILGVGLVILAIVFG